MTDERKAEGFISLREAREQLGISKVKMIKLVRESGVTTYDDPLDKRKKLIKRADLVRIARPRARG